MVKDEYQIVHVLEPGTAVGTVVFGKTWKAMLDEFNVLLLDMNDTFMFDADRFGSEYDYSIVYHQLGGTLQSEVINTLIQAAYDYLDERYPNPNYRELFPTVQDALIAVSKGNKLADRELTLLTQTFAYHERGRVSPAYAEALHKLAREFKLGLVADIWASKEVWIEELERSGVLKLFDATVFSSDFGIVKPSPNLFLTALEIVQASLHETLVIGDSVRRDLGGAVAAGLPCLLVGGATHPSAYGTVSSLLELVKHHVVRF